MSYEKFRPPTPDEVLASQERSVATIEYLRSWWEQANYCRVIPTTYRTFGEQYDDTYTYTGSEWGGRVRIHTNRTYTIPGPELANPNNI